MNPTTATPKAPGYIPDIIGFDKWPSAAIKYSFKATGGVPQLQVIFKFDISRYRQPADALPTDDAEIPQWKQNATDDLVIYKNIRYQLSWKYTPADDKPDEQLRVMGFSAFTSITPAGTYTFTKQHTVSVLAFVNRIINLLQKLIHAPENNAALKAPANKTVTIPLAAGINPKNIFEAEVTLTMTRTNADDGKSTICATRVILPDTGPGLAAFAKKFEAVFKGDDYQLKLTTGASRYGSNHAHQLWAVRMANSSTGKGIFYQVVAGTAVTMAPVPLSKNLFTNGNTPVRPYKTGLGIDWNIPPGHMNFDGMELDAWMKPLLHAIDDLFTPENINPVFTCVALYKLQHKDNADLLQDIADAKTSIITQLIKLLTPVIAGQTANLADARDNLARQLNNNLYSFYSTSAIVQYKVAVSTNNDAGTLTLTGDIKPVTVGNKTAKGVNAWGAAITLVPDMDNKPQSVLSLGIGLDNPQRQTHLPFSATFRPAQINYTPADGEDIALHFLQPGTSPVFSADVPVVIREYPPLPSLLSQTAKKTYADDAVTIPAAILWDYSCKYTPKTAAQDMVQSQLIINDAVNPANAVFAGTNELFESLAQFISVYPAIKNDLDKALPQINADTTADTEDYKIAQPALAALSQVIVNVKNALKATQPGLFAAPGINVPYSLTISEAPFNTTGDNRLLIKVSAQKATGEQPQLPQIIIKGYDAAAVETTDSDTVKSYIYSRGGKPLMFADAIKAGRPRLIKFASMNALTVQNIRSLTGICRNKNLLHNPAGGFFDTDDRFIYHIPVSASSPKLAPVLDWSGTGFDLATLSTGKQKTSIGNYLKLFFGAVAKGVEDASYTVQIQVDYQYQLDEGGLLPMMTVPITFVPSVMFNTSNLTARDELTKNIDNVIKQWQQSAAPEGYNPQYRFVISIFTVFGDSNTPLFYTDGVYIKLSDIG